MTDRPSWGWLRGYSSMGGSGKPRPDNLLHSNLTVIICETEISVPPDMPATLVAAEMQPSSCIHGTYILMGTDG